MAKEQVAVLEVDEPLDPHVGKANLWHLYPQWSYWLSLDLWKQG